MENITIGQITAALAAIIALSAGGKKLYDNFKLAIAKVVEDLLKPITDSIATVNSRLEQVDMESTKNFLVRCLADIERGDNMTEIELERFWEQYQHYINVGGNTYIKDKVEKLKSAGKL